MSNARHLGLACTVLLFSSLIALGQSEVTVKGTVLYSFTEPHALIQTKDYVARVILADLNEQQKMQLAKTGSEIKIKIPRSSIDLVWAVNPNRNDTLVVAGPKQSSAAREFKNAKDHVQLEGKILTSFNESERLIQVGSYIYRINMSGLSSQVRARLMNREENISVSLPTNAIIFAWNLDSGTSEGKRAPASIPEQRVEFFEDQVLIQGRALASFSEPHVLVQAAGQIYQLRKESISPAQLSKLVRTGSEVNIQVPTSAVQFSWPAGE